MAELRYEIGRMNINQERFAHGGDLTDAPHKYLVHIWAGNVASIYIADVERESSVGTMFGLGAVDFSEEDKLVPDKGVIIGGGRCYLDKYGRLVVGGPSPSGSMPQKEIHSVGERIAEALGIASEDNIVPISYMSNLHKYWENEQKGN